MTNWDVLTAAVHHHPCQVKSLDKNIIDVKVDTITLLICSFIAI